MCTPVLALSHAVAHTHTYWKQGKPQPQPQGSPIAPNDLTALLQAVQPQTESEARREQHLRTVESMGGAWFGVEVAAVRGLLLQFVPPQYASEVLSTRDLFHLTVYRHAAASATASPTLPTPGDKQRFMKVR